MAKIQADKIEYMRRIYQIQGWIIEGHQTSLIIRQILQNGWTNANSEKNKQRHAERMLKAARDLWTEVPEMELEQKRKMKIAELQQYKRTLKEAHKGTPSGIRALVAVDKEIIMLEGLRKPIKVAPTDAEGNTLPEPPKQVIIINGKEIEF